MDVRKDCPYETFFQNTVARLHPATKDPSAPTLRLKVAAKLGSLEECSVKEILATAREYGLEVVPRSKENERVWQLQELHLSHIESELMGATTATDLLSQSRKQSTSNPRINYYRISEPRKMRERVSDLARLVKMSPIHSWSDEDMAEALSGATTGQIKSLAQGLETAAVKLFTMSKRLAGDQK